MYTVFSGAQERRIGEGEWGAFCSGYQLVEAAGGLVANRHGEYLMIFRNGLWDLPKGKQEEGERLAQTALREVMEECHIDRLTLQALLAVTYHTYALRGVEVLKRTSWYAMRYAGDLRQLQPQREEGIEVAEFCTAEEAAKRVAAGYPSIAKVFEAAWGRVRERS
ncbi:MAG: NUDIX domain-containing protein [Prevotellaceae bacterium]|jgi:8-oxo-dGTP pyrophosphatase MutT (NUDIX family)|nr:NUDIX domain-containing protein [Prevotellaceae bacterium]